MLKTMLMSEGGVAEPQWETKILASDPAENDRFGYSVSISEDGALAVVGANRKNSGSGDYQGAAYVFSRSGSTWSQEQKLLASDTAGGDYFGASVSISEEGSRAVVGAWGKNSGAGTNQGAVYIFVRDGSTWTQEAKLLASDAAESDRFGHSVSVSGDGSRVIIGAYIKDSGAGSNQGAAYVFVRSGTVWTEEAKILPSDPSGNSNFGVSVSISGDGSRVIVGADRKNSGAGIYQGAAYIFVRSGTSWTQETKLLPSDTVVQDRFGASVAITNDGTRMIVGAHIKNSGAGAQQGAAYIFVRSGSVWSEEQKLLASDPAENDRFGASVSISEEGSRAVVGAWGKDSGAGNIQGAAYVFSRDGSSWAQEAKLLPLDTAAGDYFGHSVSISGDGTRMITSAYAKNSGAGVNQGAAYIYDLALLT